MNDAIKVMLKNYGPILGPEDEANALKEIIQQITLLGLHRGGFFEKASFYGGTALRIIFGLDRFSEDLDFCLNEPDLHFTFNPYFSSIIDELERFGFEAKIASKKTGPETVIESAFVKQDTLSGLLLIGGDQSRVHKGQVIKIRLELDKHNPPGAHLSKKLVKLPVPFMIGTLSESSLFAGKLHALIARSYVNRVKGRDYYDFLFYMSRATPFNIKYLEAKLRDSGHYSGVGHLTKNMVVEILRKKFESTDFKKAKSDVQPFIRKEKVASLDDWSVDLFSQMALELVVE